jgi:hypothetical protein
VLGAPNRGAAKRAACEVTLGGDGACRCCGTAAQAAFINRRFTARP